MKINENTIKGKWLEVKGEIQKAWGNLTDDELDKTNGDLKAISGLLQQKYGKTQKNFDQRLNDIYKKFDSKKDKVLDQVKDNLKDKRN